MLDKSAADSKLFSPEQYDDRIARPIFSAGRMDPRFRNSRMCIWVTTFQIRANGVGLKLGDFLTAFCWGCCVFVTYSKQDLYNDHAFKTNMGLQSAIVLAFLYQGLTRGDEGGKKKSS